MIVMAADVNVADTEVARGCGDVGVHARAKRRREERTAIPCREDDMKIDRCVRVHELLRLMRKSRGDGTSEALSL